eukprot:CAMPEP_0198652372 /NCGR_PEP_ID=MMETSP1467-20131203/6328_1 /TAXON_ID=1462469 /ORGANISM="unid. sp., Strain CCMP2135" /LENGTH=401 /DNA_ID=CAMNT_0044388287 /DNA_START=24 /DNA_END=1229 /DNA_ORIENTATION=-
MALNWWKALLVLNAAAQAFVVPARKPTRLKQRATELKEPPQKTTEEEEQNDRPAEQNDRRGRSVVSKRAGHYLEDDLAGPPPNAATLLARAFKGEFDERFRSQQQPSEAEAACDALQLSNAAIWQRERSRTQVEAPWVVKVPYYVLCYGLDYLFDGRPIARFWFLETVARMPYFAYISLIHLYESLGLWRRSSEAKRVHFSQEWNEYHHLLVMENLGGDRLWRDRFLAQHAAILYYWILVALWFFSPSVAYGFSELIEAHAVDTYSEFLDANEERLKAIPAPKIARDYWVGPENRALFEEFHVNPPRTELACDTLYDVFCNVRDDEMEHVCVAAACATPGAKVKPRGGDASVSIAIATAVTVAALAFQKYFGGEEALDTVLGSSSEEGLFSLLKLLFPFLF